MPIHVPTWAKTKASSKQGFDKVYNLVDKLGPPVNKLSNKIGSEAFWPTTLDKESNKAARILRSFCKDGFYVEEEQHAGDGVPTGKAKVVKKIPTEVISNAKGLAIFTTMRTGLWVSGAGGSGVLMARTSSGEWSAPSGIMLHTAGLGFLVGVDIYDCVVVINTERALQAFTKIRCTLGGEISAVAGPVGVGGVLETEVHKRQAPVFTYLKSRGFYAGVQVDGTVIIERTDENRRFYDQDIGVADILAGKVRHPPYELRTLFSTLKAAQGDAIEDSALPDAEPTPGDMDLERPDREASTGFGLPTDDDPDPFGVKALEKEGLAIKEAWSGKRPSMEVFDYKPAPSSPIYNTFRRQSTDSSTYRNSKRGSVRSISSIDRGTQTDDKEHSNGKPSEGTFIRTDLSREPSPIEKTTEDLADGADGADAAARATAEAMPQPIIQKARIVSIGKRIPPALPPRNPHRLTQTAESADVTVPTNVISNDSSDGGDHPLVHNAQPKMTDHKDSSTSKELEGGMQNNRVAPKDHDVPREPQSSTNMDHLLPRFNAADQISYSSSEYAHEIAPSDPEKRPEPNDNSSIAAQAASEEFHSVPTTPIEAPSTGNKIP